MIFKGRFKLITTVVFFFALRGSHSFAQSSLDSVQILDEVMVTASRINSTVLRSGRATFIYAIDSTQAPRQLVSVAGLLHQLPGVFNLNAYNFAQDLRLSIRGFGSRSAFGVRGVKVLVDGVPITTPDGQSQFDHIDPQSIARVEMISGPSSSLHGNASGSTLTLQSAPIRGNRSKLHVGVGSYGLLRTSLLANRTFDQSAFQVSLSRFALDGYRRHAGVTNYIAQLRSEHTLSPATRLRATLNYTNSPRGQDAGGVNLEDAQDMPRSARDRNTVFDAGEELQQGIASVVFEHATNGVELDAKVFGVLRDFDNRLPFESGGQVDLHRIFYGTTWQVSSPAGVQVKWSIGLDLEKQRDHRQRFVNAEGVRGSKTLDQFESFQTWGLFGLLEAPFADRWSVQAAIRSDRVHTAIEDLFLQDEDQGGEDSYWHGSPSLALNFGYAPGQHVFANYAHSFESPTLSALSANPSGQGGFNEELAPVIANQYELGAKGQRDSWRYQLSLYRIQLRNDLLPFELADFPGRTFFRNAGKSSRTGVEVSSIHSFGSGGRFSASYAFSHFIFANGEFEGNKTPGIPEHRITTAFDWVFSKGLSLGLDARYQSELYADDLNSIAIEPVMLLDLRAQYTRLHTSLKWTLTGGLRNVSDRLYFDNIRINAFGSRFYEPGPKINGYLALHLEF